MSAPIPFIRGLNAVMRVFQDGKPVLLNMKNFKMELSATEVADAVCGEDRDRLDLVANFYTGSADIFQADQGAMQMILDAQAADDAQGLPLNQSLAILIKNRDGTRAAYALQEAKLGPFDFNNSGRDDAVMLNLKLRCRYLKPVKTL